MKITNIRLMKSKNPSSMSKAFGSVEFDKEISVQISIMDNGKGPWVSWPSYKSNKDNKYYQYIMIKDEAKRNEVNKTIIEDFQKMTSGDQGRSAPSSDASQACPF